MADNIGMGRLWAGIHWRSDHEAGMKLGRTVARMVIEQLQEMGSVDKNGKIAPFVLCPAEPKPPKDSCVTDGNCDTRTMPPSREDLEKQKDIIVHNCKEPKHGKCDPCDAPPEYEPEHTHALIDMNRGANRGGE